MFAGLSFDTISSTGANGAIIHYKPEKDSCAMIDVDQMYLCDSGKHIVFIQGRSSWILQQIRPERCILGRLQKKRRILLHEF